MTLRAALLPAHAARPWPRGAVALSRPGVPAQAVPGPRAKLPRPTPSLFPMVRANPSTPTPTALTLHQASRVLEVGFDDGAVFRIPFELMRVYSPSAEVQGHGPGQEVLQTGKRDVLIIGLEPVGHYAVKPTFSDGHDSGLFTWAYLHRLGTEQDSLWQRYLQRLAEAGTSRDAPMPQAGGGACGHHH